MSDSVIEAIKASYIKILVVDLITRQCIPVAIPEEERKFDFTNIDEYFQWFSKSEYLCDDDKQRFSDYVSNLKPDTNIVYRRTLNNACIYTYMEIIKTPAYTDDNQECLIKVKDIDATYIREATKVEENAKRYDGMTGLLNHKAFEDDKVKPHKGNIGVAFMDINGLKHVNDTYGHSKGDELIKKVVKTLKVHFPAYSIYRVGGDEFAIIAYNTKIRTFIHTVTAFHKRIWNDDMFGVTYPALSIGYSADVADDIEEIVDDAETQMYEDKEVCYERFPDMKR